jgi:recombination protein RecA
LRENPSLALEIENKVRTALGISLLPTGSSEEGKKTSKSKSGDKSTGKTDLKTGEILS